MVDEGVYLPPPGRSRSRFKKLSDVLAHTTYESLQVDEQRISLFFQNISQIDEIPQRYLRCKSLLLSQNHIEDLSGLQQFECLSQLSLSYNSIPSFDELKYIPLSVEHLSLEGNEAIVSHSNYRHKVMSLLPRLRTFDSRQITSEEKQDVALAAELTTKLSLFIWNREKERRLVERDVRTLRLNQELSMRVMNAKKSLLCLGVRSFVDFRPANKDRSFLGGEDHMAVMAVEKRSLYENLKLEVNSVAENKHVRTADISLLLSSWTRVLESKSAPSRPQLFSLEEYSQFVKFLKSMISGLCNNKPSSFDEDDSILVVESGNPDLLVSIAKALHLYFISLDQAYLNRNALLSEKSQEVGTSSRMMIEEEFWKDFCFRLERSHINGSLSNLFISRKRGEQLTDYRRESEIQSLRSTNERLVQRNSALKMEVDRLSAEAESLREEKGNEECVKREKERTSAMLNVLRREKTEAVIPQRMQHVQRAIQGALKDHHRAISVIEGEIEGARRRNVQSALKSRVSLRVVKRWAFEAWKNRGRRRMKACFVQWKMRWKIHDVRKKAQLRRIFLTWRDQACDSQCIRKKMEDAYEHWRVSILGRTFRAWHSQSRNFSLAVVKIKNVGYRLLKGKLFVRWIAAWKASLVRRINRDRLLRGDDCWDSYLTARDNHV